MQSPQFRYRRNPDASFARDRSGVSAVEFALVGGPFLILMLMLTDVGMALWKRTALNWAVAETQRLVRVGQSAELSAKQLEQKTCGFMKRVGVHDCSGLRIDLRVFPPGATRFDLPTPTADNHQSFDYAYEQQERGAIVLLRGFKPHDVITPGLARFLTGGKDAMLLVASELVWVEP